MAGAKAKMHIKFSTWQVPAGVECTTLWPPLFEELKKRSNGRITVTMYPGGALGKGPEHYDIAAKGLSDIGYFVSTWTPGRFPLSDVVSFAIWVDGKDIAADLGKPVVDRILYREFTDVKLLQFNGCIQSFLWTRKPVRTIEDLKGLRIRTPGGMQTRYIKALGIAVVFMPLSDVYMALETGTIDGVVTCPPCLIGFKLYEVAKYAVHATFGCVGEGIVMNKKSWKNTPDDLKSIIEEVFANPYKLTGALNRKAYAGMMKKIADEGIVPYKLPPKEADRWWSRFQQVTRDWVADLEKKGLPAKETVMIYYEESEKRGLECVAIPPEWKAEWKK